MSFLYVYLFSSILLDQQLIAEQEPDISSALSREWNDLLEKLHLVCRETFGFKGDNIESGSMKIMKRYAASMTKKNTAPTTISGDQL